MIQKKIQLSDLPDHVIGEITKHLDPQTIITLLPESYYPIGLARAAYTSFRAKDKAHRQVLLDLKRQLIEVQQQKDNYQNFADMYRRWLQEEQRKKETLQAQLQRATSIIQELRSQLRQAQQATLMVEMVLERERKMEREMAITKTKSLDILLESAKETREWVQREKAARLTHDKDNDNDNN